jgi:hypothetical protein
MTINSKLLNPVLIDNSFEISTEARLCGRFAIRTAKFHVATQGEWKMYVGIGAVAAVAGGVVAWKLGL